LEGFKKLVQFSSKQVPLYVADGSLRKEGVQELFALLGLRKAFKRLKRACEEWIVMPKLVEWRTDFKYPTGG